MRNFVRLIGSAIMLGSVLVAFSHDVRGELCEYASEVASAFVQPTLPVNYEIACSGPSVSYKLAQPVQNEYVLTVRGASFGELSQALAPLNKKLFLLGGKGVFLTQVTDGHHVCEARIVPPLGYALTAVLCPPIGCILQLEAPSEEYIAPPVACLDNSVMQYA